MTAALLYPFILVAGALQAIGNAMNAQLRGRMVNPWLAATAGFALSVAAWWKWRAAMDSLAGACLSRSCCRARCPKLWLAYASPLV